MRKNILAFLTTLFISFSSYAIETDSMQLALDAIEKSLVYKTGIIELESGNAKLNVPAGFRYLDRNQSIFILTSVWGNPPDSSILGMLVPDNIGLLQPNSWLFTISFEEMGYVKDDDAEDIDYDELLKEQQKETAEQNPQRIREGYQPIEFIGWASHPYYDKDKKILHWAKELKFGEDSLHTLNYNLRVLGRKGVFMLNAIASVNELEAVKSNLDKVIGCVEFKDGNKYSDFDPDIDEVAAWTIGGLVAGKVLAKVGFFAVILKFWKVIFLAIAGAGGTIWKFVSGRKDEDDVAILRPGDKPKQE